MRHAGPAPVAASARAIVRAQALLPVVLSAGLLLALTAAAACRKNETPPTPASPSTSGDAAGATATEPGKVNARVIVKTADRDIPFRVEVVRTVIGRQQGLMYRTRMDVDAGMLFLWPTPQPLSFWMKNTLIPLDMIFIGADHKIVGIVENTEPHTTTSRTVAGDSQFVLELNGGLCARLGITAGQTVEFVGVPDPATSDR